MEKNLSNVQALVVLFPMPGAVLLPRSYRIILMHLGLTSIIVVTWQNMGDSQQNQRMITSLVEKQA
jgi:hypothetical protein